MSFSSDTESEDEETGFAWEASNFATQAVQPTSSSETSPVDRLAYVQTVRSAVDALLEINPDVVQYDPSSHVAIERASGLVISFLERNITSRLSGIEPEDILLVLRDLLGTRFLAALFCLRRAFHRIAAGSLRDALRSSAIISWADVVIFRLSQAIVFVASGANVSGEDDSMQDFLRRHRIEDYLRAATQLPEKWSAVSQLLASRNTSPAASRLALRLTFGVYVLAAHLAPEPVWSQSEITADELVKTIYAYMEIHQAPDRSPNGSLEELQQKRLNCAMLVALLASAGTYRAHDRNNPPSDAGFRPHTHARVLHLIQAVIHPNTSIAELSVTCPPESLDPAQLILISPKDTVPWCWATWQDTRVANADTITYLTVSWLYHLGPARQGLEEDTESDECWQQRIKTALELDVVASANAMLCVLHHSVTALALHTPRDLSELGRLAVVTERACWAVARLLGQNEVAVGPFRDKLGACLLLLFVLLGDSPAEISAKDVLVETLCLFGTQHLLKALKCAQDDTRASFPLRLDDALAKQIRTPPECRDSKYLRIFKLTLDLLAILWHAGALKFTQRQTISSFLPFVLDMLISPPTVPTDPQAIQYRKVLARSTCTTFATLETLRVDSAFHDVNKLWEDEAVWQLALTSEPSDLVNTLSLASLVLVTASNRAYDSLCFAEAWDHLRDAALLIFSRHFIGDAEPLALLACPTICRALLALLVHGPEPAVQFMLASPWSMNLCTWLKSLSLNAKDTDDVFEQILRERLRFAGADLLNEMSKRVGSKTTTAIHVETLVLMRKALC